jgi:hypothetical protein
VGISSSAAKKSARQALRENVCGAGASDMYTLICGVVFMWVSDYFIETVSLDRVKSVIIVS